MRAYLIIAVASLLATIGAFFYGRHTGVESAESAAAREERIARIAYEAGQQGAAGEIHKIETTVYPIRERITHELQTNTVYQTCENTDEAMIAINEARTGAAP